MRRRSTPMPVEELRRRAEEHLQVRKQIGAAPSPGRDMQRLVHELQVHQIELEMQNEALPEALAKAEASQRFTEVYECATVAYFSVGSDSTIRLLNLAGARILGQERSKLTGQRLVAYLDVASQPLFETFLGRSFVSNALETCELTLLADNRRVPVEVRLEAVTDQEWGVCNLAVLDITDRKKMEATVQHLAFHDPLTDLPNRRLLNDRLSLAMAASKRSGHHGALLFLDLDNFKYLNDTLGHEVGDMLLIEVASRLNRCVREMDSVVRFAGDEFVVLLSELNANKAESTIQAGLVAEKIRIALSKPYRLSIRQPDTQVTGLEYSCAASIGLALFIGHEATTLEILKWADTAMYQAKDAGGNRVVVFGVQSPIQG
jgi:diguanylate cyclase (GGDEF)-like protein/PAS domain S-box-containing protein